MLVGKPPPLVPEVGTMQPAHATATFSIQFIRCEQQQKGVHRAMSQPQIAQSRSQSHDYVRANRDKACSTPRTHTARMREQRDREIGCSGCGEAFRRRALPGSSQVQGGRIKAAQGEGASCADFLGGLSARLTRNNGSEVDAKVHLRCTAAWQVRSAVAANAQQRTDRCPGRPAGVGVRLFMSNGITFVIVHVLSNLHGIHVSLLRSHRTRGKVLRLPVSHFTQVPTLPDRTLPVCLVVQGPESRARRTPWLVGFLPGREIRR